MYKKGAKWDKKNVCCWELKEAITSGSSLISKSFSFREGAKVYRSSQGWTRISGLITHFWLPPLPIIERTMH